ncbi:MAG: SDR family oxidoreductase [Pseudonocardia sp.]
MRCLVLGATGYVGGRLVPRLLQAGHEVRCLVRDPARATELTRLPGVRTVVGDVLDPDSVRTATEGVDVVYHLVHSLARADFGDVDRVAAQNVALAAVGRARQIVYLGGLRPSGALSRHLSSRAEVGDVFLAGPVPAVVLQASMIIGSGSASFEMLRHLAERLPALPGPRWLDNETQPIAIADVLHYLVACADLAEPLDRPVDIGGPEVLTYRDLIARYTRIVGLPTPIWVPTPMFPTGLSALAVSGLTPISAAVAEPLLESLVHPMVCPDGGPPGLLPDPPDGLLDFEESVRRSLVAGPPAPVGAGDDADPGLPATHDPAGSGGPVYVEERRLASTARPEVLWGVIEGIGGDNGWYSVPYAWQLRGVLDRALGGVGAYRGRRDPATLRDGEVLDWWRVERVEQGRRLLLRAEMRLPGTAWLEMAVTKAAGGSEYRQRVTFRPTGPAGHLYWWAQRLGHEVVFGVMARRLVRAAERLPVT